MGHPRELVCDHCWEGLFNTQAYQDFFAPPEGGQGGEPRQVVQRASAEHFRSNCSFSLIRQNIGTFEHVPKLHRGSSKLDGSRKCNWCEYIGSYSCCALDRDGNLAEKDQGLLEITLKPMRAEYSTPNTAPFEGVKAIELIIHESELKSGRWLATTYEKLHAYTPSDDLAAGVVVSRPVRSDVGSEDAAQQIKSWISECEAQDCGGAGGVYEDSILPTRVIDIGLNDGQQPRVLETHGAEGVYATLSYCWGQQKRLTLQKDNMHYLQQEIRLQDLPQTIQDAIAITRRMSMRYLWVDALCIRQDDEVEKAKEIAHMHEIYSSSAVTIIASHALDADEGFLTPSSEEWYTDPGPRDMVVIPVRLAPGVFGTMTLKIIGNGICYDERREPISSRAWTTQEQLLARRKLMFTSHNRTMTWTCPHSPLTRTFGDSLHLPYWPGHFRGGEEFMRGSLDLSALVPQLTYLGSNNLRAKNEVLNCWIRLIQAYSWRRATLQVDKLNALAGIATQCYAPWLGPSYFAGLWEYELLRQLVWVTNKADIVGVSATRPLLDNGLSRAPSWSWASVEGGLIKFMVKPPSWEDDGDCGNEEVWMSEVVAVTATPKYGAKGPFGEIIPGSGRITLRAKLRRAWCHPSWGMVFRTLRSFHRFRSTSPHYGHYKPFRAIPVVTRNNEKNSTIKIGINIREDSDAADLGSGTSDPEDEKQAETLNHAQDHQTSEKFSFTQSPVLSHHLCSRPGSDWNSEDSDSNSDLGIGFDFPSFSEKDALYHSANHMSNRDTINWSNVNASIDEIPWVEDEYSDEFYAQKHHELQHIAPFVVYLLPLVEDSSYEPVHGLLLVKVKDTMSRGERGESDGQATANKCGKQVEEVLFRRVGSFSGGGRSEWEGILMRNVTII